MGNPWTLNSGRIGSGITKELLTQPSPTVRAIFAAALFHTRYAAKGEWKPGQSKEWAEAIDFLDLRALGALDSHEAGELTGYLAKNYPKELTLILVRLLTSEDLSSGHSYVALSGVWNAIHLLPRDAKDEVFSKVPPGSSIDGFC